MPPRTLWVDDQSIEIIYPINITKITIQTSPPPPATPKAVTFAVGLKPPLSLSPLRGGTRLQSRLLLRGWLTVRRLGSMMIREASLPYRIIWKGSSCASLGLQDGQGCVGRFLFGRGG